MSFLDKIDTYCAVMHISVTRFEREAGLSKGLISKWRNSGCVPGSKSRIKVAGAMGISADDLMNPDACDLLGEHAKSYDSLSEFRRECSVRYINVYRYLEAGSGSPVPADIVYSIPVPPGSVEDPDEYFGLIIEASGMLPEIEPGDTVIVRVDDEPASEDTVIAVTPDGVTLCRKLIRNGDSLILEPYNPHFDPEIFPAEAQAQGSVHVAGRVVALIRQFADPSTGYTER